MSKITFPGGAGGGGGGGDGSGLAPESGLLYLLKDGTRAVEGILAPDGSGTRDLGTTEKPWDSIHTEQINAKSGHYTEDLSVSGILHGDIPSDGIVFDFSYANFGIATLSGASTEAKLNIRGPTSTGTSSISLGNRSTPNFETQELKLYTSLTPLEGGIDSKFNFRIRTNEETDGGVTFRYIFGRNVIGTQGDESLVLTTQDVFSASGGSLYLNGGNSEFGVDGRLFIRESVTTLHDEVWEFEPAGNFVPSNSGAVDIGTLSRAVGDIYVGTQLHISGVAVGDFLGAGGGGGNPVDSRAATGNIEPDTDDNYSLGNASSGFKEVFATSGSFPSGIILASTDSGSGWLLTVDDNGTLTTSGPFAR